MLYRRTTSSSQTTITLMSDYPDKRLALGIGFDHLLKYRYATILRTVIDKDIVERVVGLFEE
jgi:hypothetical protein